MFWVALLWTIICGISLITNIRKIDGVGSLARGRLTLEELSGDRLTDPMLGWAQVSGSALGIAFSMIRPTSFAAAWCRFYYELGPSAGILPLSASFWSSIGR